MEWKTDTRPKRGLWAPGDYMSKCSKCLDGFIGDKRALMCADCAYAEPEKSATPMTLTPEEALAKSIFATVKLIDGFYADRIIAALATNGYRLTPIEINEAAVERAEKALRECMCEGPPLEYVLIRGFSALGFAMSINAALDLANDATRAAIVAYLEGAK